MNKKEEPTAAIIDSQSVKTAEKKGRYMAMTVENKLRDVNALSSLILWGLYWQLLLLRQTFQNV